MSLVAAAVWVFWGMVVLATVRMLVRARAASVSDLQAAQFRVDLRNALAELRVKERLESLEAGQLTLKNQVESAKVHQINRRGVFR